MRCVCAAEAERFPSSYTQNSRNSLRGEVGADGTERRLERAPARAARGAPAATSGWCCCAAPRRPPCRRAASGTSPSRRRRTGPRSGCWGRCPAGRSAATRRPAPGMRFCQISCTASSRSNRPIPSVGGRPSVPVGMLPNSHTGSRSGTPMPDSPSNSSRYAWPVRFGSGRLNATSPLKSRNDSACERDGSTELRNRLMPVGRKCSSVLAPAMRLAAGLEAERRPAYAELSRW